MKFVNSMLVATYLLIVGLTAWSLVQNFGIKEVSVEAEVIEILSVEYPGRSETNTTLLCRYSYNSREYEENLCVGKGDQMSNKLKRKAKKKTVDFGEYTISMM